MISEIQLKRLKTRYSFCFPLPGTKEDFVQTNEKVNELPNLNRVLVRSNKDLVKQSALTLCLKLGEYKNVKFMNAYRLIEIYLGFDEEYQSVSQINSDVIFIYYGVSSMTNQRQVEILQQVVDTYLLNQKKVWLYIQGDSPVSREICAYADRLNFNTVMLNDIKSVKATQSILEDEF